MKYSAYQQEPHAALLEIRRAFEEGNPYKAQSLCLSYFSYLENQRHIEKALDYADKDNVYKYLVKHMNGQQENSLYNNNYYIEVYKEKIEELSKKIKKYSVAAQAIERYCEDNKLDIDAITEKYLGKNLTNLTSEKLNEINKEINDRQKNKKVASTEAESYPSIEELTKKYTAEMQSSPLISSVLEKLPK